MATTVSRDDVLAVMPHKILTKISGEPTYKQMKQWKKEMSANLIAVKTPNEWGRSKGLLGMFQDNAIFIARNGAAYNPPDAPPLYPVIAAGSTTAEREQARAEHKINERFWESASHAARIAVDIGVAAFDEFVYAELDDPDEGLNSVEVRDIYDHIMARFTNISQNEIDTNMEEFNKGIDPSITLAVYTRKQELCQEMAHDAGIPITEAMMVSTATKHAVATGGMEQAWKEWKRRAINDRTWLNWKTDWTAHFQERKELIKLTGISFNGMANHAQEDELGDKMVTALDNLANAAVQKNDTFEQLVTANKELATSLTARDTEIKKLLSIITAISNNSGTGNNENTGGRERNDPNKTRGSDIPWDPTGYCWSHGYKVKTGHTSATCTRRKDGHAAHTTATRADPQGGCEWFKTWKLK